jgi:hypothetical protein
MNGIYQQFDNLLDQARQALRECPAAKQPSLASVYASITGTKALLREESPDPEAVRAEVRATMATAIYALDHNVFESKEFTKQDVERIQGTTVAMRRWLERPELAPAGRRKFPEPLPQPNAGRTMSAHH